MHDNNSYRASNGPPEHRDRAARRRAQAAVFAGFSGRKMRPPDRRADIPTPFFPAHSPQAPHRPCRRHRIRAPAEGRYAAVRRRNRGRDNGGRDGPFAGHAVKTKPAAIPAVVPAAMPGHPAPAAASGHLKTCRCPNMVPFPAGSDRPHIRCRHLRGRRPDAPLHRSRSCFQPDRARQRMKMPFAGDSMPRGDNRPERRLRRSPIPGTPSGSARRRPRRRSSPPRPQPGTSRSRSDT